MIHYTGDDWRSSRVQRTAVGAFDQGSPVHVRCYDDFYRVASLEEYIIRESGRRMQNLIEQWRGQQIGEIDTSPEAVVARAESRLGQGGFDFVFNNCEHFATWCKTGLHDSRQIETIWKFTLNPSRYTVARISSWLTNTLDGSSKPAGQGR